MHKFALICVAAAALMTTQAHAAEPGDLPLRPATVDGGDKPWMWVKPAEVGKNDTLKCDLERGLKNRFAFDPKKPLTAVYLVAGPVIAIVGGGAAMGIL